MNAHKNLTDKIQKKSIFAALSATRSTKKALIRKKNG